MKSKFEVVILSHNRPQLLAECLRSWLHQDLTDTKLIVSDNSTDSKVWEMLLSDFPQVEVRRRLPSLASVDHFNACREEVKAEWYMLFHDDDIMLDGGWKAYKDAALSVSKDFVAVAANAFFVRGNLTTSELYNGGIKSKSLVLNSPLELFSHYCGPISTHHPFPSYIYRTAVIQPIYLALDAGKYSDTTFLMKACNLGKVLWLQDPQMGYRTHGKNDSTIHNVTDAFRLYSFAEKYALQEIETDKSLKLPKYFKIFKAWQILLHLRELWRSGKLGSYPWRRKIMFRYAVIQFLKNPQIIMRKFAQLLFRRISTLRIL